MDSPRDSPYFLMFGRKRTAPRKLLRTAGYRGMGERDGEIEGGQRQGKKEMKICNQKVSIKSDTEHRPLVVPSNASRDGKKRKALTGISDLKLFPVKSRNKSRLKKQEGGQGVAQWGASSHVIDPLLSNSTTYFIQYCLRCIKNATHLRSKVPDEKL